MMTKWIAQSLLAGALLTGLSGCKLLETQPSASRDKDRPAKEPEMLTSPSPSPFAPFPAGQ